MPYWWQLWRSSSKHQLGPSAHESQLRRPLGHGLVHPSGLGALKWLPKHQVNKQLHCTSNGLYLPKSAYVAINEVTHIKMDEAVKHHASKQVYFVRHKV